MSLVFEDLQNALNTLILEEQRQKARKATAEADLAVLMLEHARTTVAKAEGRVVS